MSVIDRRTKLKARRVLRKQKRHVEAATAQADDSFEKLILRRFSRLIYVKRFVGLWVAFALMLIFGALWQVRTLDKFYLTTAAVDGGVYREGILGTFTNSNPMFATSSVDSAVSRLIYSGLYQVSPNGDLVNDLANGIEIDEQGKEYVVSLRQDVKWQDGEQFDANDVLFTYNSIKDPDVKSPLLASWQGVKVTKVDDYTVKFELPNALSSFQSALINGIVPQHILAKQDPEDLRSSSFNTVNPVGTGLFTLRTLEVVGLEIDTRQERIALNRYDDYHGRVAGLDGVIIRSYRTTDSMQKDFEERVIQSMVGLTSVPEEVLERPGTELVTAPLTSSVMVFMNSSNPALSDVKVRRALLQSTDVKEIRRGLGFRAVPTDSPFLRSQFAYNPAIVQHPFDIEAAKALLTEAGWVANEDGKLAKDGNELKLRLVSQSLSEYATIAQKLQSDWSDLGIGIEAILQPEEDIQSGAIARHEYDILLYGISLGHDPDVFAYWHSSQAGEGARSRLNLSEYKSEVADEALEAGRTRVDEDLRTIKYEPFITAWRDDVPAIALYQPRFLMVVQGTFEGFERGQLSTATDRYWSIANWRVRNAQVAK
ncbi:MAG: peptide/nickel transport system substrate-binding protein [Candidatus Saccharimonadales bacterium]|jgi:peptide/nickel transport system substrate-binding protein